MPEFRIGISGWTYPPWRGSFYPAGLPQKSELAYASRRVNSIEINGTFYSLQRPSSYRAWAAATPEDFVFSVKGPRFITHLKRLQDVAGPLANFFASGVLQLGQKLGPILWQTPPSLPFAPAVLEAFCALLPRDTTAAAALARRHDSHLRWPDPAPPAEKRRLRHALEIRHPSFAHPAFIRLLRRHRVGLVVADTAGKWPLLEDVTADFVYLRLHGDEQIYVSGYAPRALDLWAKKIRRWAGGETVDPSRLLVPTPGASAQGRDIFVYFDNDVKTRSPFDAIALARRLGLPQPEASDGGERSARAPGDEPAARRHWPALRRSAARTAAPRPA